MNAVHGHLVIRLRNRTLKIFVSIATTILACTSLTACVNWGGVSEHDIGYKKKFGVHAGDDLATASATLKDQGFSSYRTVPCAEIKKDSYCTPEATRYTFYRKNDLVVLYASDGAVKKVIWTRYGLMDALHQL